MQSPFILVFINFPRGVKFKYSARQSELVDLLDISSGDFCACIHFFSRRKTRPNSFIHLYIRNGRAATTARVFNYSLFTTIKTDCRHQFDNLMTCKLILQKEHVLIVYLLCCA